MYVYTVYPIWGRMQGKCLLLARAPVHGPMKQQQMSQASVGSWAFEACASAQVQPATHVSCCSLRALTNDPGNQALVRWANPETGAAAAWEPLGFRAILKPET